MKIEGVNGEDHFAFRIGKEIGDENGKLRLISEITSDIDEEFCAFFVDWMGTGSFPGVKSGRGVTLTLKPLLVPWS